MTDVLSRARALARQWALERRALEQQLEQATARLDRVAVAAVEALEMFEGLADYAQSESGSDLARALQATVAAAGQRLEDAGIVLDGAAGEVFDPARHQAVHQIGDDDRIAAVVNRGITCAGRRLRRAQVVTGESQNGRTNRN